MLRSYLADVMAEVLNTAGEAAEVSFIADGAAAVTSTGSTGSR